MKKILAYTLIALGAVGLLLSAVKALLQPEYILSVAFFYVAFFLGQQMRKP